MNTEDVEATYHIRRHIEARHRSPLSTPRGCEMAHRVSHRLRTVPNVVHVCGEIRHAAEVGRWRGLPHLALQMHWHLEVGVGSVVVELHAGLPLWRVVRMVGQGQVPDCGPAIVYTRRPRASTRPVST